MLTFKDYVKKINEAGWGQAIGSALGGIGGAAASIIPGAAMPVAAAAGAKTGAKLGSWMTSSHGQWAQEKGQEAIQSLGEYKNALAKARQAGEQIPQGLEPQLDRIIAALQQQGQQQK